MPAETRPMTGMMSQSQSLIFCTAVVAFSNCAIASSGCSRRSNARVAYARATSVLQLLGCESPGEILDAAVI
ncbi:hypothetical protein D3C71_2072020 [compost metagenome]